MGAMHYQCVCKILVVRVIAGHHIFAQNLFQTVVAPIEAGNAGVIRAAGVAFVKMITSPDVLGVVIHKRLAEFVCEMVFVFRTIDQSGWHKLSVYQSIECGNAGGVTIKWRT